MHDQPTNVISTKTLIPIGTLTVIIGLVWFAANLQNKAEATAERVSIIEKSYVTAEILNLQLKPINEKLDMLISGKGIGNAYSPKK